MLTNRRHYQFDYRRRAGAPGRRGDADVIYAVRFSYPAAANEDGRRRGNARVDVAAPTRRKQSSAQSRLLVLRPSLAACRSAASDDGVQTRLRFDAHAELPAVFVRNDDGSESLLNFQHGGGDVSCTVWARRFVCGAAASPAASSTKLSRAVETRARSGTVALRLSSARP